MTVTLESTFGEPEDADMIVRRAKCEAECKAAIRAAMESVLSHFPSPDPNAPSNPTDTLIQQAQLLSDRCAHLARTGVLADR